MQVARKNQAQTAFGTSNVNCNGFNAFKKLLIF